MNKPRERELFKARVLKWADKLDANNYATHMEGEKYLVSFRKPGWKGWSTEMKGHKGARQRTIAILEDALARLSAGPMPDPDFATDLEEIKRQVQGVPVDPWAPSSTPPS